MIPPMASDDTSTRTSRTSSGADDHPAVRLARRLSADGVVDFHGLGADLRDLGQAVAVRAALHAADAVRERWAAKPSVIGEADGRALQTALDAARAWLAAPGDRARREAHRASSRIKPLLRGLERRAYPSTLDPDELDLDEDDLDDDLDDDLGEPDVDLPDDFEAALAHHAGTAVFAAARAAHARTAGSAAMHAGGALAAAYRVIDLELEEAAGDLALDLPLVDPACAHAHGREPAASRLLLAALTAAVAPPSP